MPIINIQRRMAEQGRIRLGHKVSGTSRQGKAYTRPAKLERFRFTSPSERLITEVSNLYGGTPAPWDNDGKAEHEVLSEAKSIPVIVVKGGFSQWYEAWSKAGCIHRCDGEKDVTGTPCDPQDPAHIEATEKPTTRLSVMLSEVESLGVWRMESKGWNAAAELPSMAELAMHVGDLVPATLSLIERSSVIQVNSKPQTSRFVVPVLDLHVSKARLVELVGGVGGTAAIGQGSAPSGPVAIDAPRPDYAAIADTLLDVGSVKDLWRQAGEAGHLDDALKAALTARVEQITALDDVAEQPEAEDAEHVEAELVDDETPVTEGADPRAAAWQELLAAGGTKGMGFNDVRDAVEQHTAQPLADCTSEQLAEVLQVITTGEVA